MKENPDSIEAIHKSLIRQAETLKPPDYDVITEYYHKTHFLELIGDLVREAIKRGVQYPVVKKILAKEYKLAKNSFGEMRELR